MTRILFRDSRPTLGLNRLDALGELFDAALRGIELGRADAVELFAALPEHDRLVQGRVAALEPLDDRLQLALRLVEGELAQRLSSTVAPKPPAPSSTSTRVPVLTSELERTIVPSVRTIA